MVDPIEKAVLEFAKQLMPEAFKPPIDPTRFGDPLALKVDWGPVRQGGEGMKSHRLTEIGRERLEFRAGVGPSLMAALALALGVAILYYGVTHREDHRWWIQMLVGLVFSAVGTTLFVSHRVVVFDRKSGWFYRGRLPKGPTNPASARLSSIHALQIVREVCSGAKSGSFNSYEINIVLNDGTRHNVIDHSALSSIRADAARLGQFLGVPVWDATLD
jgi:hypothetical protein